MVDFYPQKQQLNKLQEDVNVLFDATDIAGLEKRAEVSPCKAFPSFGWRFGYLSERNHRI